ncbi:MAG TPA: hypothetical protein VLX61_14645 [Anaerolineales bacterium]|nr:hypothetical protein [Anaerolineales bacterium]
MNRWKTPPVLFPGIGGMLAILLIVVWYKPLSSHVFMGDDLLWIQAYNAGFAARGFWLSILTMGQASAKFRPMSNALILLSTDLCRNGYGCYVRINCAILLLNAALISMAAYWVSARWWPSAVMAALALIVSRFAYYDILAVMGLMESLSLTFVLLFALCGIRFVMSGRRRWLALQILCYVLALLSHERFMVLIVPLFLSAFLERARLKKAGLFAALAAAALVTSAYLVVKQFVLGDSVFEGTAGTSVLATFHLSQFLSFLGQGFLNLIGFNMGPAQWSGAQFTDAGFGGILVGAFLSGSLATLTVLLVRQRPAAYTRLQFKLAAFLVVTIAVLLVSASITFRQEFRWLYAPFAAFILLVVLLLGGLPGTKVRLLLGVILAVAFTAVDLFYRPLIHANFNFMSAGQLADSVKTQILDKLGPHRLSRTAIYVVTNGNGDYYIQGWILGDEYFFQLYSPKVHVDVHYVNSLSALPTNIFQAQRFVVFQILDTEVVRVPNRQVQQLLAAREPPSAGRVELNLLTRLPAGVVNRPLPSSPPTDGAPFIINWNGATGAVAVAGAPGLRFSTINCAANSHLRFRAGMPYAVGDGADLTVIVQKQRHIERLADISFRPASVDRLVSWSDYDLPIQSCRGGPVDVTFLVNSPSFDTAGDVIAVADIELILPDQP